MPVWLVCFSYFFSFSRCAHGKAQGRNNIQNSCRQQPTLGYGNRGFILGDIFSLSQSSALFTTFPNGTCFVKGTNGNFQLGSRGGEREGVRGKCEKAPSKDSIRTDQIKPLASSAPKADRLTICPIGASGTAGTGARGVLRSLQTAAPPSLGTPDINTDNNIKGYLLRVLHIQQIILQHRCHICVTVSCWHVNKDIRKKVGPAPEATVAQFSSISNATKTVNASGHIVWQLCKY